ncbi:MAG: metal-dependent hydrolase [Chlamydiae bacterium]|nr:metal-dependent hydrolase [Chlamydiota bacterium]MBI3276175.1 metal-dependent hydrolase [Chlamydiota bacterium]
MPSSLAHSMVSAIFYKGSIQKKWNSDWKLLLFFIFCGNSPDLDFIPGLFVGDVYRFHHQFSHSFLGATAIALFLWFFYGIWRKTWRGKDLFIILVLVNLHLILDIFVRDPSPPYGCPLFYPFYKERLISPFVFFGRTSLRESPFSSSNLWSYWIEFAVFAPLVLAWIFNGKRKGWVWMVAGALVLGVILHYLYYADLTSSRVQFIKVFLSY